MLQKPGYIYAYWCLYEVAYISYLTIALYKALHHLSNLDIERKTLSYYLESQQRPDRGLERSQK
jgi:hypothetical protein